MMFGKERLSAFLIYWIPSQKFNFALLILETVVWPAISISQSFASTPSTLSDDSCKNDVKIAVFPVFFPHNFPLFNLWSRYDISK